jgi:predicted phage-related endonuclease
MNVHTPTDEYGDDFFKKTYGDFFPDEKIFGGMWDSLVVDKNGKPTKVIECKTTKRAEDWEGGKIPEYYALQAALYAYLLGVDDVLMVASFLEEKDYDHPELFKPSVKNTILVPFKISERYPKFKQMVSLATKWWKEHVDTGISPEYDETRDADFLKALRTNHIDTSATGLDDIVTELEQLTDELAAHSAVVAEKEARVKTLKESLSKQMKKSFKAGDKSVVVNGSKYLFTCTKSQTESINKDALKADGLYDQYKTVTEKYTLTTKMIKGE